jgi:hypothetical protein
MSGHRGIEIRYLGLLSQFLLNDVTLPVGTMRIGTVSAIPARSLFDGVFAAPESGL